MANTSTDFCPNGHDKRIVGTRNRMCKECRRELRRQQWAKATPEEKAHVYEKARQRYESGATQNNIVVPICPQGHDKRIVGVCKNGACRQCFNEKDAIRRTNASPEEKARKAEQNKAAIARRVERTGITYRREQLLNGYGITVEQFATMLLAQCGVCAICRKPETRIRNGRIQELTVDHDHKTGVVRSLLCSSCNVMLGYACDDPQLLISAAEYLFRYS